MRVEATIPDSRGVALKELAEQLGLSKSQIIDEALSLFLMAVMEIRHGRRFMSVARSGGSQAEIITPTLAQLEWVTSQSPLVLNDDAVEHLVDLVESPPAPNDALKAALNTPTRLES